MDVVSRSPSESPGYVLGSVSSAIMGSPVQQLQIKHLASELYYYKK